MIEISHKLLCEYGDEKFCVSNGYIKTRAVFSECKRYRYELNRIWERNRNRKIIDFVTLAPGSGGANSDDATIRRCKSIAVSLGFGGMTIVNAYGLISNFREFERVPPEIAVGVSNDLFLRSIIGDTKITTIVAAWGNHVSQERKKQVLDVFSGTELWCLAEHQEGFPIHPLNVFGSIELQRFQ